MKTAFHTKTALAPLALAPLALPAHLVTSLASHPRRSVVANAQQRDDALSRMLRKVQGALPVVGLISRLATPEGGIGSDHLAYPEYCRAVFEAAPEGFQIAVAELQTRYGKAAQRRYVLLCLWMVQQGVGLMPEKSIVDAARRLRVSQDIEFEMDRFSSAFEEAAKKFTYVERPRGRPQELADVAVDALSRLCLGLQDGSEVPEDAQKMVEDAVCGGLYSTMAVTPSFREMVKQSIATRNERSSKYA